MDTEPSYTVLCKVTLHIRCRDSIQVEADSPVKQLNNTIAMGKADRELDITVRAETICMLNNI